MVLVALVWMAAAPRLMAAEIAGAQPTHDRQDRQEYRSDQGRHPRGLPVIPDSV
jgi:hypothetical protein